MRRTRGAVGYNYAPQPKYLEPFKNLIKSKSKWLGLIKDINFNYIPSQLSFRADVFRQFGATRPRNVGGGHIRYLRPMISILRLTGIIFCNGPYQIDLA